MNVYVEGVTTSYDIEHLARIFWAEAGIKHGYPRIKGDILVARMGTKRLFCAIKKDGISKIWLGTHSQTDDKEKRRELSSFVFNCLVEFTGKSPAWGLLIGVRPVRLIHDMWEKGMSDAQVGNRFINEFHTSKQKYDVTMRTAKAQKKVVGEYTEKDFSIYVSIPFCPTRCSYCSFISRTTHNSEKLIEEYIQNLCQEIKDIKKVKEKFDLNLKTIYIGGGTPTSITAVQLEQLMACIRDCFDITALQEYTVEAGRPDCTDREKLAIIKQYGATRISINPQTFNDSVLAEIGRKHTSQDIIDCFNTARELGHDNINMDLIAGLPTDTVASFNASLEKAVSLNPENITVHTLTLKRASNIVIESMKNEYDDVEQMLEKQQMILENGYEPYYLYRQKNTLENLENTSFCKQGYEGMYNIYIMEEIHSILSAGAGGVTKLRNKTNKKIERIFNFKYPNEYNKNLEKLQDKKRKMEEWYGNNFCS